jgi:hypothetical protein
MHKIGFDKGNVAEAQILNRQGIYGMRLLQAVKLLMNSLQRHRPRESGNLIPKKSGKVFFRLKKFFFGLFEGIIRYLDPRASLGLLDSQSAWLRSSGETNSRYSKRRLVYVPATRLGRPNTRSQH